MKNKKPVALICFMFVCFASMLGASLYHRFANPGLTINAATSPRAAESGESREVMNAIGSLMQAVAKNPKDLNATLRLTETLMALGQWETAQNFAQKALALENDQGGDGRAFYLMALVHHNLGRHDQAAELLEKLLKKDDNPSARYSLGILYAHYLNRPGDGIKEFQKGIESKKITPALKEAMTEELEKISRREPSRSADNNRN
ncbi:MAG: tetratricopeptide repeat protein [Desulfovibrio sp.]|nr:tetratricopeptide repeat protein [Desulfovibrio sp.]